MCRLSAVALVNKNGFERGKSIDQHLIIAILATFFILFFLSSTSSVWSVNGCRWMHPSPFLSLSLPLYQWISEWLRLQLGSTLLVFSQLWGAVLAACVLLLLLLLLLLLSMLLVLNRSSCRRCKARCVYVFVSEWICMWVKEGEIKCILLTDFSFCSQCHYHERITHEVPRTDGMQGKDVPRGCICTRVFYL